MPQKITVVHIKSLSYTGTTWVNTVLGCHRDTMAIGPLDAAWPKITGEITSPPCLIHGNQCKFWPKFTKSYDEERNFFVQLAEYSGKNIFITNNLLDAGVGKELQHPDIVTKHIHVIRDGRSLTSSYCRKFPDKSMFDAISGFLQPSFHYFDFDLGNPDILCLKYEDIVRNQAEFLQNCSDFLKIDYSPDALAFWEFDHHLVQGNQGTIAAIKFHLGMDVVDFEGKAFYQNQYQSMRENRTSFRDERTLNLTPQERIIFDLLAGKDNERFGYDRDTFNTDECIKYLFMLEKSGFDLLGHLKRLNKEFGLEFDIDILETLTTLICSTENE